MISVRVDMHLQAIQLHLGNFASADYKDGGMTWFTTNDADANFEVDGFYNSTDGGVTWTQTANFITLPAVDLIANVEVLSAF